MADQDVEKSPARTKIPHYRLVLDKAGITPEVEKWEYEGSGTNEDPYVVGWIALLPAIFALFLSESEAA